MARRINRSPEFYRRALQGDKENFGLRQVARGFSSREGFNLRDGLTSAQKRKIAKAFEELQSVTAQPRYVYKPKSSSKKEQEKLRKALQVTQSETTTKWKVAFIPHTPRKLKSGKDAKPTLYFGKEGVTIRERGFAKIFVPLDSMLLVVNPSKTIKDAIKREAPKAQRFTIQAGANEMPVLSDAALIAERVIHLMNKYDGKKPLPKGSGNAGDNPKHHKYDLWLHGLIAYQFPKVSAKAVSSAVNEFDDARRALQLKRRAARARVKYQDGKRNKRR